MLVKTNRHKSGNEEVLCGKVVTFGASKTESSSPEETVKSQESVSTDICSKGTKSGVHEENVRVTAKIRKR